MAKKKKIKLELLVVTEVETKRKSWTPSEFWNHLLFTEACGFIKWLFIIAVLILIYARIVYSDDLTKRIFEWLLKYLINYAIKS